MTECTSLSHMRILILDHALFVDKIPIHGPGLSVFSALKKTSLTSLEYCAHCLECREKTLYLSFKDTSETKKWKGIPLRFMPAPIAYVYVLVSTVFHYLFTTHDVCIALNPLNFIACYVLAKLRRVKHTVFYAADYSKTRFSSRLMNTIYAWCDAFAAKHADQVWSVSSTIAEIRTQQNVSIERNFHIPNSPILAHFTTPFTGEKKRYEIVYVFGTVSKVSDLFSNHQFDLLLDALKQVIPHEEKLHLSLIGRGDMAELFAPGISERNLESHVTYYDITDRNEYIEVLRSASIGVAFYNMSGADHLKYGDSMKIREYIAAGLPVITTPGHSLARDVENKKIGYVVHTREECVLALQSLACNDTLYNEICTRVKAYAQHTDKVQCIVNALDKLTHSPSH